MSVQIRQAGQPTDRSHSPSARWVWLIPLIAILLTAGALYYTILSFPVTGLDPDTIIDPLALVIAVVYSVLGAFIAQRRPGNRVAWILMAMALVAGLYQFSMQYSIYAFLVIKQPLPLAAELSWVQAWAWFVPLNLMVQLVFYFPNGQPLSPRWRALALVILATIPALILMTFIYLWPHRGPLLYTPDALLPAAARQSQDALRSFWMIFIGIPLIVGMPAAVISLFLRLRRAEPVERLQIKWFLFAGGVFSAGLVFTLAVMMIYGNETYGSLLWAMLMPVLAVLIPVTVSMAILRHRLYEIDLIIRRTLMYSVLTSILAAIYLLSVVALQNLLTHFTGSESSIAIVISTLLIAALFSPLRRRLQYAIDRRFYRSRYSTDLLVSNLTVAMQSEVDLERLANTLVSTVENAVQPESASLWLRKPGD